MKTKTAIAFLAISFLGFTTIASAQVDPGRIEGELQPLEKKQSSDRPDILERPKDFSKAPEIKKPIDGPSPSDVQASIDRGAKFLLRTQNKDGSFGTHETNRLSEIYAPIPGAHNAFRSATTALSISALIETKGDSAEFQSAIDDGEKWMLENMKKVKRATGDAIYNVWGHAYGIQALVKLKKRCKDSEKMKAIDDLLDHQVDMLVRYESVDGGWGYYDFRAQARKPTGSSISFVNATVLIAFKEAADVGVKVPQRIVKRATDSIIRQQKPDFTYLYGEYLRGRPMRGINRPGGSLARSQACNLALRMWGDEKITDNVIKAWLYRLYLRNGWLDMGRKRPIPHESWMAVAGYFYYYGHYYAGLCIDELQPADRAEYRAMLSKILLKHQEPNGCWWDYTLYSYHQQYGTAYSLMAMQRCLPDKAEEPGKAK